MADLDYNSHPAELVAAGVSCSFEFAHPTYYSSPNAFKELSPQVGIKELRKAIPEHCFKPSYWISFSYLFRDLAAISLLLFAAFTYVPKIDDPVARWSAWALYGYVQGLLFTGLWVCSFAFESALHQQS